MNYFTLTISGLNDTFPGLAEQITFIAWQAGCSGVEEPPEPPATPGHPAIVAPAPPAPAWRIYFAERLAAESCRDVLLALFRDSGVASAGALLEIEARESENWMAGWRDYFHPVRVGEGFLIVPPWWNSTASEEPEMAAGRTVIRIEPGMAFGTGTHATTQLCLELAEPRLRPGLRVLDVGTGSGILLIAAALRGATPAVALDNDPETIENFRLNLELNGLTLSALSHQPSVAVKSEIRSASGGPKSEIAFLMSDGIAALTHLDFDLIFANLLAPHIESLFAQMREPRFTASAARPLLIGSGLLADEWPALRRGWEDRYGLAVEREAFRAEWMAFAGRLMP